MKNSFSFLELILTLALLAFLYSVFIPKLNTNNINELTNKLTLYISYARYKALVDEKYEESDSLWHKKRWTMKFFRCRNEQDGIYFSIYSDRNKSGHPSKEDSLKDPLSNKHIYSSNYCNENKTNSKYVLLTKNFDIKKIDISCNSTSSLGQLSFGSDGKVYTKLSNEGNGSKEYEIKSPCEIRIIKKDGKESSMLIENSTGYVNKMKESMEKNNRKRN